MPNAASQKTITFGIPCYNAQDDMDKGIASIIEGTRGAADVEIIIVDDGSTDATLEKAQAWSARFPELVRVIHQENGGHGAAVLTALNAAQGAYYKVLDSDDWFDVAALTSMLTILRGALERQMNIDLFISNYVYEKVHEHTRLPVRYRYCLPHKRIFGWSEIGRFLPNQNLLMHSLCYRTELLRKVNLPLPRHTFYVDNIYAYVPLPHCQRMYYADIDLYRYFIGREGQSVNEKTMVSRLAQQFRVTRILMRAYRLDEDVPEPKLRSYMMGYFEIMMAICSTFAKLSEDAQIKEDIVHLWEELRGYDEWMYRRARWSIIGTGTNLPGSLGEHISIGFYRVARRIFKFS